MICEKCGNFMLEEIGCLNCGYGTKKIEISSETVPIKTTPAETIKKETLPILLKSCSCKMRFEEWVRNQNKLIIITNISIVSIFLCVMIFGTRDREVAMFIEKWIWLILAIMLIFGLFLCKGSRQIKETYEIFLEKCNSQELLMDAEKIFVSFENKSIVLYYSQISGLTYQNEKFIGSYDFNYDVLSFSDCNGKSYRFDSFENAHEIYTYIQARIHT